mgnify:CR=1 FL=1
MLYALTLLAVSLFASHLRQLRTDKLQCLKVSGFIVGSVIYVCYTTCHTQAWARDLGLVNLHVRYDGALAKPC